jgi:hypothetical protein
MKAIVKNVATSFITCKMSLLDGPELKPGY